MKHATVTYPDDLSEQLDLSDQNLPAELLFLAAAKLYELGRLTAGQAAELAKLSRLDFLERLDSVGVAAINLGGDEANAEVTAARDLAK